MATPPTTSVAYVNRMAHNWIHWFVSKLSTKKIIELTNYVDENSETTTVAGLLTHTFVCKWSDAFNSLKRPPCLTWNSCSFLNSLKVDLSLRINWDLNFPTSCTDPVQLDWKIFRRLVKYLAVNVILFCEFWESKSGVFPREI